MAANSFFFLIIVFFVTIHFPSLSHASNHRQSTVELWCVAKNNADTNALQFALDWACGQGGANCRPIQPGGSCYDSADITRTASYAFNDYYLKHGLTDDTCNFDNTAALTSLNPSHGSCKFQSSSSVRNNGSSPGLNPASGDLNGGGGGDLVAVRVNLVAFFAVSFFFLLY
ncbi:PLASMODESMATA CALLOSE-BINDING PROTEIN 5-like [Impatiens glandulifera]|uniref:PLASMODESMATA CALLOSE-BINDING PROTEIN 5-like n=1 Tax=Impatiens glandulifera TaxID=253017 RepID=UPI001FB122F0|nr:PLASMODESMATA CALLOSE-BINDING PROTEIN 5-like [Impatiens glandulifera]